MWECKNCGEKIEDEFTMCWKCGTDENGNIDEEFKATLYSENFEQNIIEDGFISEEGFLLSNTSLEILYPNINILGVVFSEHIILNDLIEKAIIGFAKVVGGKEDILSYYIKDAKMKVSKKLIEYAKNAGANAIMGVKYDHKDLGDGMILVSATGTAVII